MARKDQDKPESEPETPAGKDIVEAEDTAQDTAMADAAKAGYGPEADAQADSQANDTSDAPDAATRDAADDDAVHDANHETDHDADHDADHADHDATPDPHPYDADTAEFPAAVPGDVDLHHADHHDELDEHSNFPGWLKGALILIAGVVLALWGGPQLAPHLPSGMEPVARFLTPGGVRQAEEINDRLAALEQREPPSLPQDAIDAAVSAALADYDATVSARFQELDDTLSAVGSADIKTRLAQLETSAEGLESQMGSLSEKLSTAIAESIDRQTAISAEQAAAYQAVIDGLNAELDQVAARQGALQQTIDEVAAANTRIRAEAETIATETQADTALADISAALSTGAPFRSALDSLSGAIEADLPALQGFADSGAPTLATLKSDFAPLAYAALREAMQAEAQGYTDKAMAFFKGQVATRSLTPQPGNSTDAILSRMDAALSAGNLAACLAEADALSEAARAPLADWLASVSGLSAAMSELDTATAQVARQKS